VSPTPLLDSLRGWLRPEHLTRDAVTRYRDAFAAARPPAVVLRRFLHDGLAEELAAFLGEEAAPSPAYGLTTRYGFVSAEDWHAAPASERFFRYGNVERVAGDAARGPRFITYERLVRAFSERPLRGLFEAISGMSLGHVTLAGRRMDPGDFLAPHTDDVGARVLSFVIYLSPWWTPSRGAALVLADGDGGHVRVDAEFNSVVLFDARAWHHISPFAEGEDPRPRLSLGGWFLRRGAPPEG